MEGGGDRYERAEYHTQFIFPGLEPNMNYQCGGVARIVNEEIEIENISLHTDDQVPQKIESVHHRGYLR